jgi:hypothetical protein
MSVMLYWKDRLEAQNPLYCEALRVPGVNVKAMPGMDGRASWPRAVSRAALYEDYQQWHKDEFCALYRGIAWSGAMPQPAAEFIFFCTVENWLYVVGKEEQVRAYRVNHMVSYEGEWVKTKKLRYFIRLLDWKYHAAQFELTTGIFCFDIAETVAERIKLIEDAKANYKKLIHWNRAKFQSNAPNSSAWGRPLDPADEA